MLFGEAEIAFGRIWVLLACSIDSGIDLFRLLEYRLREGSEPSHDVVPKYRLGELQRTYNLEMFSRNPGPNLVGDLKVFMDSGNSTAYALFFSPDPTDSRGDLCAHAGGAATASARAMGQTLWSTGRALRTYRYVCRRSYVKLDTSWHSLNHSILLALQLGAVLIRKTGLETPSGASAMDVIVT